MVISRTQQPTQHAGEKHLTCGNKEAQHKRVIINNQVLKFVVLKDLTAAKKRNEENGTNWIQLL